jgi:hypothetical protein
MNRFDPSRHYIPLFCDRSASVSEAESEDSEFPPASIGGGMTHRDPQPLPPYNKEPHWQSRRRGLPTGVARKVIHGDKVKSYMVCSDHADYVFSSDQIPVNAGPGLWSPKEDTIPIHDSRY